MKKFLLVKILRQISSKPNLLRKLKIFAVLGLIGFIIVGGLTIWAGIATLKFAGNSVSQVIQLPTAQAEIENFKSEIQSLEFQTLNCWNKAQSLLSVKPWVEKPALDNFRNLKLACLEEKPWICEGNSCEPMKELNNTAEGRTI